MKDYAVNKCDEPVPALFEFCKTKDFCRGKSAEAQIKSYNVLSRIVMEMINDISQGFTWQSIIVVAAVVMTCMCCRGFFFGRDKDGKISVTVGDTDKQAKLAAVKAAKEDRVYSRDRDEQK